MIERHAKRRPRAAVVPGDVELPEAEVLHRLDLVLRHAAERVVAVVGFAARLRTVAIAAEIGAHHGEVSRQLGRDEIPRHVRERVAVQQQHRRALAPVAQVDRALGIAGRDLDVLESLEHGSASVARVRVAEPRLHSYDAALAFGQTGCSPIRRLTFR
jgi:hypothetical protein